MTPTPTFAFASTKQRRYRQRHNITVGSVASTPLLLLLLLFCTRTAAFSVPVLTTTTTQSQSPTVLHSSIAAPAPSSSLQDWRRRRPVNGNGSGGFVRTVSQKGTATSSIPDITTLDDFKDQVVHNPNYQYTVVRFYAPWCRACHRQLPTFKRLAKLFQQDSVGGSGMQFVQVPLTKTTAVLHQGLDIPSLPYCHVYDSQQGVLLEERKLSGPSNGKLFQRTLQGYADGYCRVDYEDDADGFVIPATAAATTP